MKLQLGLIQVAGISHSYSIHAAGNIDCWSDGCRTKIIYECFDFLAYLILL